jgi:hypothetical protein
MAQSTAEAEQSESTYSTTKIGSPDSTVGIATDYRLDGRRVGVRVLISVRFSTLRVVQIGYGAHPVSYPLDTGAEAAGVWTWPLNLQMVPALHPLPHMSSRRSAHLVKHEENFTFS